MRRSAKGHEERFPPPRLNAGSAFRKETIAGTRRNGRDAPFPAIASALHRQEGSTDSGHHRRTTAAAITSAGMRQQMVMRSETTDGSGASKCKGQWTHHAAQ